SGNKVYILPLAPRPAGKARATSIPGAVCKERATPPAGLRAAARRGAAAGGHLLCCRSSTMHTGIACVAAPCICPPGARAKMHTLFPDGPLPRVGHPRQFLPTVVDFFNGTHNVVHIVLPPQQQPVLQPHRFAAGVLRVGTEVRKGCVIDLARVVVTGGRT